MNKCEAQSRFRVVKVDAQVPLVTKKGRWTCKGFSAASQIGLKTLTHSASGSQLFQDLTAQQKDVGRNVISYPDVQKQLDVHLGQLPAIISRNGSREESSTNLLQPDSDSVRTTVPDNMLNHIDILKNAQISAYDPSSKSNTCDSCTILLNKSEDAKCLISLMSELSSNKGSVMVSGDSMLNVSGSSNMTVHNVGYNGEHSQKTDFVLTNFLSSNANVNVLMGDSPPINSLSIIDSGCLPVSHSIPVALGNAAEDTRKADLTLIEFSTKDIVTYSVNDVENNSAQLVNNEISEEQNLLTKAQQNIDLLQLSSKVSHQLSSVCAPSTLMGMADVVGLSLHSFAGSFHGDLNQNNPLLCELTSEKIQVANLETSNILSFGKNFDSTNVSNETGVNYSAFNSDSMPLFSMSHDNNAIRNLTLPLANSIQTDNSDFLQMSNTADYYPVKNYFSSCTDFALYKSNEDSEIKSNLSALEKRIVEKEMLETSHDVGSISGDIFNKEDALLQEKKLHDCHTKNEVAGHDSIVHTVVDVTNDASNASNESESIVSSGILEKSSSVLSSSSEDGMLTDSGIASLGPGTVNSISEDGAVSLLHSASVSSFTSRQVLLYYSL